MGLYVLYDKRDSNDCIDVCFFFIGKLVRKSEVILSSDMNGLKYILNYVFYIC